MLWLSKIVLFEEESTVTRLRNKAQILQLLERSHEHLLGCFLFERSAHGLTLVQNGFEAVVKSQDVNFTPKYLQKMRYNGSWVLEVADLLNLVDSLFVSFVSLFFTVVIF